MRILIVRDHKVARSAVRSILERVTGWKVVAEVDNGKDAVAKAVETRPDVAIIDDSSGEVNSIETIYRIHVWIPKTDEPILLRTADDVSVAVRRGDEWLTFDVENPENIHFVQEARGWLPYPKTPEDAERMREEVEAWTPQHGRSPRQSRSATPSTAKSRLSRQRSRTRRKRHGPKSNGQRESSSSGPLRLASCGAPHESVPEFKEPSLVLVGRPARCWHPIQWRTRKSPGSGRRRGLVGVTTKIIRVHRLMSETLLPERNTFKRNAGDLGPTTGNFMTVVCPSCNSF